MAIREYGDGRPPPTSYNARTFGGILLLIQATDHLHDVDGSDQSTSHEAT